MFFDFAPEPSSSRTEDAFHAHARGWCSPRANVFTYESGAMAGKSVRRPVHTGDSVEIGVVLAGTRICQPERGPAVVSARVTFSCTIQAGGAAFAGPITGAFTPRCADH